MPNADAAAVLLRQAMRWACCVPGAGWTGKIKDVRRARAGHGGCWRPAASSASGRRRGLTICPRLADIFRGGRVHSGYPLVTLVLAAMVAQWSVWHHEGTGTLLVLGGLAVLMGEQVGYARPACMAALDGGPTVGRRNLTYVHPVRRVVLSMLRKDARRADLIAILPIVLVFAALPAVAQGGLVYDTAANLLPAAKVEVSSMAGPSGSQYSSDGLNDNSMETIWATKQNAPLPQWIKVTFPSRPPSIRSCSLPANCRVSTNTRQDGAAGVLRRRSSTLSSMMLPGTPDPI